jgi:ankyrin repeat protein
MLKGEKTPLFDAVDGRHFDAVCTLLDRGADLSQRGNVSFLSNPCESVLSLLTRWECCSLNRESLFIGLLMTSYPQGGITALHRAAMAGDTKIISLLLDRGPDLEAVSVEVRTLLC